MPDLGAWTEMIVLAVLGLAVVLTLVNLALLFALRREIRALREEHGAWHKRLDKEVALSSPTRAAIAAVIATSREKPLTLEQFQQEMNHLLDQWEEIETLAERAQEQLAALVDENREDEPLSSESDGRSRR